MRVLNRFRVIVFFALLPQWGIAAIRPSFTGDSDAWRSTDIVVVSLSATDGNFVVEEIWKGNLRLGVRVVVPELIPERDAVSVSLYPEFWKSPEGWNSRIAEQIPRQPVGSRLILFLKKKPSNSEEVEWEPANWMHSMKASVVWIDGEQLWSFGQIVNPGPSVLQPMGSISVQELRGRISKVLQTQKAIQSVIEIQNGLQRAQLLKPFLRSDVHVARRLAMEELGKSGPTAVPTIRGMLDDPEYADDSPELIKAMVEAGGAAVGSDLNHRFQHEIAFWESVGPTLAVGWWNKDPNGNAPLRLRYSQLNQLIMGLQQIRSKDSLPAARELDQLWVSNPQLNDPSGLNQISVECEKLIKLVQEEGAD
jgi:hypothetical protein